MDSDLSGKVMLITGATSGIGEAAAVGLARLGAHVVIHGRSQASCQAAAARVRRASGSERIDYLPADLASQAEVRALAAAYMQRYPRLDVLLNNAGISAVRRQLSPDGIERVLAVNHLSHFLLSDLLLETLRASAPARVINVSSYYHRRARLNWARLQAGGLNAYPLTKLCNVLFTYELARRLQGSGITVNALDPGLVRTHLSAKMAWPIRSLMRLMGALGGVSVEQGARTSIYLASAPELAGVSGQYFADCRPQRSSRRSYDRTAALRLWRISAELTCLAPEANSPQAKV